VISAKLAPFAFRNLVDREAHDVAHLDDVPAIAIRDEPVLGLLQFRLGNHERVYQPEIYRSPSAATVGGGSAAARQRRVAS
jgi:hypothetical protein